jgi:hypothetical protein
VMLFVQTAAPTGWTKSTTHNNKALRVVSGTVGSGGTVAFTTAFASKAVSGSIANATATNNAITAGGTVANRTLSTPQIPSHSHNAGGPSPRGYVDGGPDQRENNTSGPATSSTGGSGAHNHGFTGTSHNHTQNAHNHTFTGTAIDLAVQYVDVIIATKD